MWFTQWRWSDGSPWVYTSWLPDQPDDFSGNQYFVYTNQFGLWGDIQDGLDTYICEIEMWRTNNSWFINALDFGKVYEMGVIVSPIS